MRRALLYAALLLALFALAFWLTGCAAEGETAKHAAMVAGAGAAGALVGGPIGAGVGAGVADLFNRAAAGDAAASEAVGHMVASLGFFGRIGVWLDGVLLWAGIALAVALVLMPRWRAQAWALLSGLPRMAVALFQRDSEAAKNALTDVVLAAPRMIGAVRESPRTRPVPKEHRK